MPLRRHPAQSFVSLRALAAALRISRKELRRIAATAGRYYAPFVMKKGDKTREIDRPESELKKIQGRINAVILRPIEMPEHLHGGVRGRSPITNARMHLASKYLVRLDITDYFPSITHHQVFRVWRQLGFSPGLARLLTQLTTFCGYLPQGAPTSTALANMVLLEADEEVKSRAKAMGITYTRFVDDLALSGDYPQALIPDVVRAVQKAGFRVKRKKLELRNRSARQELTGYTLNSPPTPSKGRWRRDRIRAAINRLPDSLHKPECFDREVRSVRGRILDVRRTNPGAALRLERQLNQVVSTLSSAAKLTF